MEEKDFNEYKEMIQCKDCQYQRMNHNPTSGITRYYCCKSSLCEKPNKFDISKLSKEELIKQLYQEMNFSEPEYLSKILIKELPKKYVYRIICKLYRLRKQQ